jgi:hypothetical protein
MAAAVEASNSFCCAFRLDFMLKILLYKMVAALKGSAAWPVLVAVSRNGTLIARIPMGAVERLDDDLLVPDCCFLT